MLEEFRALGGTADNVRLGLGPLGRGREGGSSGFEETYHILHLHRMHFLILLAAVEVVSAPMEPILRRLALHQLQTLSFSYSVRAV
jgi:hypothetical protein